MNLKTSQIIQINQNYGSHRKSEVTDNHGRLNDNDHIYDIGNYYLH